MRRRATILAALLASSASFADEFSFDIDAFEKKPFEWHGYAELRYESMGLNSDSALYDLNYPDGESREERINGALELSGDYRSGDTRLSATWHGSGADDSHGSLSEGRLYEGYLNRKESGNFSWELGKRALKWGKGYAWNPVGFVERPKDPTDPELGREGYVLATADWVKSSSGNLKTVSLTPVLLPVTEDINDDFGNEEENNLALKLYLLYRDVDIDIMALSDGSRPGRIGADFSLNLATNFEIHGEWAYIPDNPKKLLSSSGAIIEESDSHAALIGLRYLTESDTTWITEYLHQDHGYTAEEMSDFYDLLAASPDPESLALSAQQGGYLRPSAMRDYFYLRASQKEPFDWLYTTLALTAIKNLEDDSTLWMPEFAWTGVENVELRLRLSLLDGDAGSEYGEKINEEKAELRLRYFF